MNFSGKVLKYGSNVDTDVIIPARYLNSSDKKELAAHCMEDLDKTFVRRVRPGDILAADYNFGCGSSREHAPLALKECGISCVVAKSFARIFYRNAVNIGLPAVEYGGVLLEGDEVEISLDKGELYNRTRGERGTFPPFPPFLRDVLESGGLLPALKKRNR